MAHSSEHGGIIRSMVSLGSTEPMDSAGSRDGVINGLNHISDQHGQCLVNRAPTSAIALASPSTTAFGRMIDCRRLSLRVAPCGASYLIVPYLRASISAAGTATFRVAVVLPGGEDDVPLLTYPTMQKQVTTTSTTAVDVTVDPMYIQAPAVFGPRGLGFYTDPSLDGSGDAARARTLTASIQVWALTSLITSVPTIHAFSCREYWHDV